LDGGAAFWTAFGLKAGSASLWTALTIKTRPPTRLPCQEVIARLHIHPEGSADEEGLARLATVLDELAAVLGLDGPPSAEIGGNYSFYGMSAAELRETLRAVKTDQRGLFHVVDNGD
jgi:hypothetical protein